MSSMKWSKFFLPLIWVASTKSRVSFSWPAMIRMSVWRRDSSWAKEFFRGFICIQMYLKTLEDWKVNRNDENTFIRCRVRLIGTKFTSYCVMWQHFISFSSYISSSSSWIINQLNGKKIHNHNGDFWSLAVMYNGDPYWRWRDTRSTRAPKASQVILLQRRRWRRSMLNTIFDF